MILKSLGKTRGVWYGVGMQYPPTWPVTKTWLTTVLPPYMRGVGVNLALWRFSLRIGVYRVLSDHQIDDYDVTVDDVLEEIEVAGWASGSDQQTKDDQSPRSSEPSLDSLPPS